MTANAFDNNGQRGSGQPAPHATQEGATTPDQRARAAVGNVAESHRAPQQDRSTGPLLSPSSAKLTNREVLAKLRVAARKDGRCIECRKHVAKPGRVTCQACLDKRAERDTARVAAGLCPCGRRKRADRYSCNTCLRAEVRKRKKWRAIDRALKRCTTCRKNPAGPKYESCTTCRKRAKDRREAKLAELERRAA